MSCSAGWTFTHRWGKWRTVNVEQTTYLRDTDKTHKCVVTKQIRTCEKCGLEKTRILK